MARHEIDFHHCTAFEFERELTLSITLQRYQDAINLVNGLLMYAHESPSEYSEKYPFTTINHLVSARDEFAANDLKETGNTLCGKGEYKEALAKYEMAIKWYPQLKEAQFNQALVLHRYIAPKKATESERNKVLIEALEKIDKALEIDPNYTKAIARKAWILVDLKRYQEALPIVKRVLNSIDSTVDSAWQNEWKATFLRLLTKCQDNLLKNLVPTPAFFPLNPNSVQRYGSMGVNEVNHPLRDGYIDLSLGEGDSDEYENLQGKQP